MPRKSHRKSRTGCSNCKQRRIKCDEQKPICQRCITRDEECTYPSSKDLLWVDRNISSPPILEAQRRRKTKQTPPSYSSSPQDGATEPSDAKDPSLNLDNIELIINWITATVHTVNPPSAVEICQTFILKQAMQHNFLLHGLLALSALHLSDSHADSQQYTQIATSHHTRGLTLYHSILASMNKTNYSASIAFSSITAIFTLGMSRPQISRAVGLSLLDDLIQVFQLSDGWRKVVQAADDLELLPGSKITDCYEATSTARNICSETETAFACLHALNQGQEAATYTLAISALRSVFETFEGTTNDNPHVALEWVDKMPEEFISLMRERQTLALVVVAHYCVVLHRAPKVWWLRGWSEGLFGVIWRGIDPAYRESLQWVRQQIGFAV